MSNTHNQQNDVPDQGEEEDMLNADDADEVIEEAEEDGDVVMDSDGEEGDYQEIELQNDSIAYFDSHKDSIFSISLHPLDANIVATGGGDDLAYVWNTSPDPSPVLPASYQTNPQPVERQSRAVLSKLPGHKDSVTGLAFTLPNGEYLVSTGMDGQILVWHDKDNSRSKWKPHAKASEVEEVTWLQACSHPSHPNSFAIGANDGSVWVYEIFNVSNKEARLNMVQAYFLQTQSITAGSWTPDGKLLITASEDGSICVWDPWGDAAVANLKSAQGSEALIQLTAADERVRVDGGFFSVTVSPGGSLAAVGGADGSVRIVGLPRIPKDNSSTTMSQGGQILAVLHAHSDSVESLSFSYPPTTILASGSVDGSIILYDVAHDYAIRRTIPEAHDGMAVTKLQFPKSTTHGWNLTSSGYDGVVKRWDVRGGAATSTQGLIKEFRGHRGQGEGGGIMDFAQDNTGNQIVTAGDDSVSLVFTA